MKQAMLVRSMDTAQGTFGRLLVDGKFAGFTLEEPWKDNKTNISCIPADTYRCKVITRPSGEKTYQVMDVPNRTGILIHSGNHTGHIEGCILLGDSHGIVENKWAVLNSKATVKKFMDMMGGEDFELAIRYTVIEPVADCAGCRKSIALKLLAEVMRGA